MQMSAFSRFGFFRFVGGDVQPWPQVFYNALSAQLQKAFDLTPGLPASEDNEAELFAIAYALARAQATLVKAGLQRDVTKVTDLLALQEASYLYTPLPNMTLYAQGQALAAIKKLNLGASSSNITNVLTNTLGAAASGGGFVGLKLLIATVPASPPATDEPTSNFQQLTLEGKWLQLTAPVGQPGSQWANYGNLDPTIPLSALNPLAVGDVVTVQGENRQCGEVVTVTGVQTTSLGVPQFQATFTRGHDQGATVLTSSFPRWTSQSSIILVEVQAPGGGMMTQTQRTQVDAAMQRVCRGVCQWAEVYPNGGFIGPFTCNVTPLGTATVGTVSA